MRSGKLRHRIQIFAMPVMQDDFGQEIDDPTPVFFLECQSEIKVLTSREVYALGAGFDGQVTHKITIRYPQQMPRSGMQIHYGDRTFTLQTACDPDELTREVDLIALEHSK